MVKHTDAQVIAELEARLDKMEGLEPAINKALHEFESRISTTETDISQIKRELKKLYELKHQECGSQ